jgi:predicted dehydrogenase
MASVPTIVVAGFSGYGDIYLKHLLPAQEALGVHVIAVADPDPSRSRSLAEIRAAGIEIHPTLESMYARLRPDMAILATPVHEHARHLTLALSHGSHVLCEKPLASSMADVHRLIEARRRAHKVVTIGYQWSHCPAILALRRDVAAGLFGAPRRMRTLVLWPRDASYFTRNDWAGRVSDANGRPILDSPVHNACAHFVHNALFVLGPGAYPTSVHAELYRANDIESYDTAAVRSEVRTASGERVESMNVTTLAVTRRVGPQVSYECDDATLK